MTKWSICSFKSLGVQSTRVHSICTTRPGVDETKLSEYTGTQLTRSLVTELEAGAGSTTAASKAKQSTWWVSPGEAALTRPALKHHKNTIVLAHNTKNSTSSCTTSHKNLQQNHDDGLKLKTKPRRRRTSVQQQVQEEKDKLRSWTRRRRPARSKPSPPASNSSS
jgi:hypothetical protein